jgi:GNAT superfamily N-acetyltransferase
VIIDEARVGEADTLTRLALASKRHWGYDDAFMERCRAGLAVHECDLVTNQVFVARDADRVLGFYQLLPLEKFYVDLDMLFVEPRSIGDGVGGALMRHASTLARSDGALTLRITADPFAVPFYEHFGAVLVGSSIAPSTGRSLPVYEIAL